MTFHLNEGSLVKVRRFKDLCCEFNVDTHQMIAISHEPYCGTIGRVGTISRSGYLIGLTLYDDSFHYFVKKWLEPYEEGE